MLLIGSQALKYYFALERIVLDCDLIATFDEVEKFIREHDDCLKGIQRRPNKTIVFLEGGNHRAIYEFELAWSDSTGIELLERSIDRKVFNNGYIIGASVATLDELYTLKMSHRYLKNSPHFKKTRQDILLMRQEGVKIWNKDWYKRRMKETYNYKHPSLMQGKKDFFSDDGINYIYDHDSIHLAVKHLDKPAYEYYKRDDHEVFCDKDKFFSLPESYRLFGVLEETYVLALERSQVPFRGNVDPKDSFMMALKKVCTSIT